MSEFISQATEIVLDNLSEEAFGVADLATELSISRFQLHRKLKAEVGLSVSRFIRNLRLKEAAKLLKESNLLINEVGYSVGFSSASYFNNCFQDQYNCTPKEFRDSGITLKELNNDGSSDHKLEFFKEFWKEVIRREMVPSLTSYLLSAVLLIDIFLLLDEYFLLDRVIFTILLIALAIGLPISQILAWRYSIKDSQLILVDELEEKVDKIQRRPFTSNRFLIALASVIILLQFAPVSFSSSENNENRTLAVSEFIDLSSTQNQSSYGVFIKNQILRALSQSDVLIVPITGELLMPRSTLGEDYIKNSIRYLINGSFLQEGNMIVTNIFLSDLTNGKVLHTINKSFDQQDFQCQLDRLLNNELVDELENLGVAKIKKLNVSISEAEYWNNLGNQHYENFIALRNEEDIGASKTSFLRALVLDSSSIDSYYGLGKLMVSNLSLGAPPTHYKQKIIDSINVLADNIHQYSSDDARGLILRGLGNEFIGDYNKAIELQLRAVEIAENNPEPYNHLGRIYFDRLKDPVSGFRYYLESMNRSKSSMVLRESVYKLGVIYQHVGAYDQADNLLKANARLHPNFMAAKFPMAWIRIEQGKFNEAESLLDSICSENPSYCEYFYRMINTFTGDFVGAFPNVSFEEEVISKDDSVVQKLYGDHLFGYALTKTGHTDLGLEILTNVLEIHKATGNQWLMAETYAEMNQYDSALLCLERLNESDPFSNMFEFVQHYSVFDSLRENPRFERVIELAESRKKAAREAIIHMEDPLLF